MWTLGWREQVWSALDQNWDIIIIGGGITGAGILREATHAGYKALLVEAGDFASGTSSRSSKLVHGGLRYLRNGQLRMTIKSVHEREHLLREGRGLINPMGFIMTCFTTDPLPAWLFGIGLTIYDLLAFKWEHRYYDVQNLLKLCPQLNVENLRGGYRYIDAQTDDARLVLRVIREACEAGGIALNYARVEDFCRTRSGQICGIILRDVASPQCQRIRVLTAPLVINATGAWADELRAKSMGMKDITSGKSLRRIRGSHLVFPHNRFPLNRAISFCHPSDGRAIFAFPWLGVTIIGTTDVDHLIPSQSEPTISDQEADYLMRAIRFAFPSLELDESQIQCTFSGIRAVLNTGKSNPSKESREHIIWFENGLLTVTGGKLTTFRITAHDALRKIRHLFPKRGKIGSQSQVLDKSPYELLNMFNIDPSLKVYLLGRYGAKAVDLVNTAQPKDLEQIATASTLWGDLKWACQYEGVIHLDDLLLRRTRLGLLLPNGGMPILEQLKFVTQSELKWDDQKWKYEVSNYRTLWQEAYAPRQRALVLRTPNSI